MKKLIAMTIIIAFGTQTFAAKKIDKKEYAQLIVQCQAIRAQMLQQNNFEVIRNTALQQFDNEGVNSLTHRFTSLGSAGLDSPDFAANVGGARTSLNANLDALERAHNLKLNALIINTIATYLNILNTKTSKLLLAELIANGFNF